MMRKSKNFDTTQKLQSLAFLFLALPSMNDAASFYLIRFPPPSSVAAAGSLRNAPERPTTTIYARNVFLLLRLERPRREK